jgi:hypothetical protein
MVTVSASRGGRAVGRTDRPARRRPEPLNDARQFPIWVDQGARIDGGSSTILVEFAAQAVAHGVEELLTVNS